MPNSFSRIIFFLLWPFGALIFALIRFRERTLKIIFPLFSAYQGFTYTIASTGLDANDYKQQFQRMAQSEGVLSSLSAQYLSGDSGVLDFGVSLISFFVSRLTDDYRFFFAVLGLVMGIFIVNIFWFTVQRVRFTSYNIFTILLVFSFVLVVGMWDIGGRWNIAAAIFTYGVVRNEFFNDRKSKIFIGLAVLFHWSFVFGILVYVLYKVIGNRPIFYFTLLIISFFTVELNLSFIRDFWYAFAPGFLIESRSSYLDESYSQLVKVNYTENTWYIKYYVKSLQYFLLLVSGYLVVFKQDKLSVNPLLLNFTNVGMFFLAIFKILSAVPSMGRFIVIGLYLLLFSTLLAYSNSKIKFPTPIKYFGYFALTFYIVVRVRIGLDFWNVHTVFGNIFTALVADNPNPLIEGIKSLLK
jgi:hypothetical protein